MPNLLNVKEKIMKAIRIILSIAALLTVLPALANAQDFVAQMEMLEMQSNMQLQQAQTQMLQADSQRQQAFLNYYRQRTDDYATSDQQAAVYGEQYWCQDYPVECQQYYNGMSQISAAGHQQNMNDITMLGNTATQTAQTNNDILNMSHEGYMNRSAATDQGQAGYVQGAIYGESTYYSANGSNISLPVYPDQNMSYTTPEGYPLTFDYQTNTWYQIDNYGFKTPLNQQQ
jgi:hypothetical protein